MTISSAQRVDIVSPLDGTTVALRRVPHPVFASASAGAGLAVVPDPAVEVVQIKAPASGVLSRVSYNRFVLEPDGGTARILVQAGIDTESLKGQGYSLHFTQDSHVRVGVPVMTYAPKEVGRMGFDPIVVVVVQSHEFEEIEWVAAAGQLCGALDVLFRV